MIHWVTMSGTTNENEWQRVIQRKTTSQILFFWMTWYWYEYIKNEKMTLASTALGSNNFNANFKHNLHFVTFCHFVCNVYRNKFFYILWPCKSLEERFRRKQVISQTITAWKLSVFGIVLICIFPHSDWIRRDTIQVISTCAHGNLCPSKCSRILSVFFALQD